MEEADLLKERLQAITEKRKVQDDIAKKRRQIEEEKLKLHCLKKKSLREQWLMDGLSPQSEENQEANKLQAQGDQEQTLLLQSDIDRMEKEIEALETQELQISANEEVILKRLKDVERTAEDIIKELNAEYKPDPIQSIYPPIPHMPDFQMPRSFTPTSKPRRKIANLHGGLEESNQIAMFAMEISVEKDMRTGESQVVSTATLPPEEFQQKGVKVYDDGKKSVYALNSGSQASHNELGLGELSNFEVEELLRQASDATVPTDVQYHKPVYAALYTSRSSTPAWSPEQGHISPVGHNGHRTSSTTSRPPASCFQMHPNTLPRDEALSTPSTTPHLPDSPLQMFPDTPARDRAQNRENVANLALARFPTMYDDQYLLQLKSPALKGVKHGQSLTNGSRGAGASMALHPETDWLSPNYITVHSSGESPTKSPVSPSSRQSPCYASESDESFFNVLNTSLDMESEPVTMIFMGYQNASEDEDEENIQAELVVIGNGDEEEKDVSDVPSFHPEGYQSKIFQPTSKSQNMDSTADYWEPENLLHQPTFTHKHGKRNPCQDRPTPALEGSITVGINVDKNIHCLLAGLISPSPALIKR